MAEEKTLLLRWPFLTPEDHKKIEFAWAHAPSRYVTNHIRGGPEAIGQTTGFRSIKDVMDALREVNRVYGTSPHYRRDLEAAVPRILRASCPYLTASTSSLGNVTR